MVLIKRSIAIFLTILFIAVIIGYLYYNEMTMLIFINSVFIVSLFYIMIGALFFVTRGGFFDGITLSVRRFMKKGTRMGATMEDVERMDLPSEAFEYSYTEPLLLSGFIGFLLTVLISYSSF
ncbi:DUF3899 domain-containing protein [Alkalihalobacillus sp. AL-G]|uniref:DUF3899 domain-containing protein n=1 Tax=Alkalihalobacillus sp. AL-G TaxID=2926399 RepID=UPI00272A52CA|nr:DUF3899 domain-containing protein [Alkalihalobacillus sp. AL-G]WLD94908.1 DUF3899 domain-containing protein [Alkalihalobacillus sp. AL-G]